MFPAKFEEGCPYGENEVDFLRRLNESTIAAEGVITLPEHVRAAAAATNPVAFVMENKMLLHDIMNLLIGLPPESEAYYGKTRGQSRRRARYYRRRKGIFGFPLYMAGVTEDHKRGTLHWHINVAAGPSAYLLQRFSCLPEVCDAISEVLDSMYCSKLEEHSHVVSLTSQTVSQELPLVVGTR